MVRVIGRDQEIGGRCARRPRQIEGQLQVMGTARQVLHRGRFLQENARNSGNPERRFGRGHQDVASNDRFAGRQPESGWADPNRWRDLTTRRGSVGRARHPIGSERFPVAVPLPKRPGCRPRNLGLSQTNRKQARSRKSLRRIEPSASRWRRRSQGALDHGHPGDDR